MKGDFHLVHGVEAPRYTQVPHLICRDLMPVCSGVEFKVLIYMCDMTWGYHHDTPDASFVAMSIATISQATGLARSAVQSAVREFEQRGLVESQGRVSKQNGTETKVYRLRIYKPAETGDPLPPTGNGVPPTGDPLPPTGNGVPVSGKAPLPPTGNGVPVSGNPIKDEKKGVKRKTERKDGKERGRACARATAADAASLSPEQSHEQSGETEPLEGQEGGHESTPDAGGGKRSPRQKARRQGEQLPLPGIQKAGRQESKGQAAAREFLQCVKRYGEIATVPRSWSWASARMLKEAGPEVFRDFVAWAEQLPWLDQLCPDGRQTYRQAMGLPKFEQLWLEFLAQRGKPAPIIPIASQRATRDAGRITDASAEEGESGCALCGRPVRAKHSDDCPVLEKGYGPDVQPDHRNGMWCVNHGIRRRKRQGAS